MSEIPDFLNKKLNLPIFPQDNQDPLKSVFELDTIEESEPELWTKENPYLKGGKQDYDENRYSFG